jgi:GT2 family glycosyltransferase
MHDHDASTSTIGVVVIGRNEGARLRRCLGAALGEAPHVVYVDSGSGDDSVLLARSLGVETIALDPGTPFSAARARNEGFEHLRRMKPGLTYVQFVDGDCELCSGWLAIAAKFLADHNDAAVVSGRLREKHPERSIYNTLCDIEWDVPAGEVKECGGVAMFRASALDRARGFRVDLIAGEEPELCVRLRKQGWRIWRLTQDMALHDSDMSRFAQWWKREQRAGHAFAQGAELHGAPPERHYVREFRSALFWGLGIPLSALALMAAIGPLGLLALAIYPLQVVRLALRGTRSARQNWLRAAFLVVGKFPEVLGGFQFYARRVLGRQPRLIEYK